MCVCVLARVSHGHLWGWGENAGNEGGLPTCSCVVGCLFPVASSWACMAFSLVLPTTGFFLAQGLGSLEPLRARAPCPPRPSGGRSVPGGNGVGPEQNSERRPWVFLPMAPLGVLPAGPCSSRASLLGEAWQRQTALAPLLLLLPSPAAAFLMGSLLENGCLRSSLSGTHGAESHRTPTLSSVVRWPESSAQLHVLGLPSLKSSCPAASAPLGSSLQTSCSASSSEGRWLGSWGCWATMGQVRPLGPPCPSQAHRGSQRWQTPLHSAHCPGFPGDPLPSPSPCSGPLPPGPPSTQADPSTSRHPHAPDAQSQCLTHLPALQKPATSCPPPATALQEPRPRLLLQ